jgi:hypothetical protein
MALIDELIDRFKAGDVSLRPDVVVYTILIKACAHSHGSPEEKQQALAMATDAMHTLESSDFGPPNDIAYATLMNAIFRLSESVQQRESLLEAAFRGCAERGYVSTNVLKEMDRGGSRRLFRRLTNNTLRLLPLWSANVAAKDRPPL